MKEVNFLDWVLIMKKILGTIWIIGLLATMAESDHQIITGGVGLFLMGLSTFVFIGIQKTKGK